MFPGNSASLQLFLPVLLMMWRGAGLLTKDQDSLKKSLVVMDLLARVQDSMVGYSDVVQFSSLPSVGVLVLGSVQCSRMIGGVFGCTGLADKGPGLLGGVLQRSAALLSAFCWNGVFLVVIE